MQIHSIVNAGAKYFHQCPGRDKIPIWLIVFGVFALIQTIVNGMRRCIETCRESDRTDGEDNGPSYASRGGGCCEGLISLFLFAWLIVGSVWVFSYWNTFIYSQQCLESRDLCCHPVPYWFSFITLIVIYAGALLSLLICCCCCCCIGSLLF